MGGEEADIEFFFDVRLLGGGKSLSGQGRSDCKKNLEEGQMSLHHVDQKHMCCF